MYPAKVVCSMAYTTVGPVWGPGVFSQILQVHNLTTPGVSCVILGKLLNLSDPKTFPSGNGNNKSIEGLNELMRLADSKCSMSVVLVTNGFFSLSYTRQVIAASHPTSSSSGLKRFRLFMFIHSFNSYKC